MLKLPSLRQRWAGCLGFTLLVLTPWAIVGALLLVFK